MTVPVGLPLDPVGLAALAPVDRAIALANLGLDADQLSAAAEALRLVDADIYPPGGGGQ